MGRISLNSLTLRLGGIVAVGLVGLAVAMVAQLPLTDADGGRVLMTAVVAGGITAGAAALAVRRESRRGELAAYAGWSGSFLGAARYTQVCNPSLAMSLNTEREMRGAHPLF